MADISVMGGGLEAAAAPRGGAFARLAGALAAEGERRILWAPVWFGAGIAVYFALTVEPPLWLGVAAFGLAAGAAISLRRRRTWRSAAWCLTLAAAGFSLTTETTRERMAPMLDHHIGATTITGRVIDIDTLNRGWRIVVTPEAMSGLDPARQPRRLRIHISAKSDLLNPGDRVQLKASLYPVPAQSVPGGHDMQRELFFAEIGGVGYSLGGAHRIGDAGTGESGWRQWVLQIRTEVTRRITAVLPGSSGGVATAVIAGKRGTIEEPIKDAFRNSGLSHLLAIAGLHLGLVGAFVFFAVRSGLALIPYVALRLPIKKIAAGATLAVLFCYLLRKGTGCRAVAFCAP